MKRSKNPRSIQVRSFRCSECGAVAPATKTRHKTSKGHIKHMYCHVCKKETEHVQTE